MKYITLVLILLGTTFASDAQVRSHKQKHSTNAGSFFFWWGYNRGYYTKSNIRFVGSNYDFTLKHVTAADRPDKFKTSVYFNPTTITVPQYDARIGYYFKDKWAVSIGVDHLKYVMADQNHVLLNGHIDQGVDTNWVGNYYDQPVVTNRDQFHYENTNGMNYIRLEVMRSFDLWEYGNKRQFAVTGNLGVSTGPILTFNDLNFAQRHTFATPSLSGYGIGAAGSIRLEFFRHIFFQVESAVGFVQLLHVRTRPDDRNQYAKQVLGFSTYNASLGAIFYFKSKNGCDSCPHW